ncbi:MAG: N-acetylglucosamine-6-phosphate deacetylase [Azospirillum sp.]|nr:N-acetylglucosamine-6-phosphate deacetylase [Azospirillum sp.]
MDALRNVIIHTGDGVETDAALLIADGVFVDLVPESKIPAEARSHDLGGDILAPGFIDAQVNGGGGVLFNDRPDRAALRQIAAAHRRFGTTGLLATVITDRPDVRRAAAAAVREAVAAGEPGILGIHFEGPHIAPARRGVHAERWIAPASADDVALACSLPGIPTLVTLAPEAVAAETIRRLSAAGVRVALGHTDAGWAAVMAALDAGASGFTHLFNAMSPLNSREPGAVGAALDHADSWCGIIVDGHHVHDAAVRLAWRVKPRGRLFLVTDAMPPVGTQCTEFSLYGAAVTVADGRCLDAEGRLAGSALDMATAVRNCVCRIGIPLDEALRMASTYPARFLGIADRRGRIAPGLAADLVRLDGALAAREIWVAGRRFAGDAAGLPKPPPPKLPPMSREGTS